MFSWQNSYVFGEEKCVSCNMIGLWKGMMFSLLSHMSLRSKNVFVVV